MARLRREAEEAKERERRAAEEHREKFKGKSAISSSDFFGVSVRKQREPPVCRSMNLICVHIAKSCVHISLRFHTQSGL